MSPQTMPSTDGSAFRLPPEKHTSAVPKRANPRAMPLREEKLSWNRMRENTATHAGAVYNSTIAMAAPLSWMEICSELKNTLMLNTPKREKNSACFTGMRAPPQMPVWAKKQMPPSRARQKATSSGARPSSMQILEKGPMSDHRTAAASTYR